MFLVGTHCFQGQDFQLTMQDVLNRERLETTFLFQFFNNWEIGIF